MAVSLTRPDEFHHRMIYTTYFVVSTMYNMIVYEMRLISAASEVYGRSLCNHRRAYKFFTDSASPSCAFPAVPCESYEKFLEGECFPCKDKTKCGNMGYHSDKSPARGKMYLLTRDEEPFCGKYYNDVVLHNLI